MPKLSNLILKPIYYIYERWLYSQIKDGPVPKHVGIIPDGNRRWASTNSLSFEEAYSEGYKKLKEVLIWLLDLGVKAISVYALSTENCAKRSSQEVNVVLRYIKKGLEELLTGDLIHKYRVRVKVIGKLSSLPEDFVQLANELMKVTEPYHDRKLTLAVCYGGRQEILDAMRALLKDIERGVVKLDSLEEDVFKKYFYDPELEDLDLVIRTSGEVRISNFLLWHIAYSELFFADVYWPEFRKIDLWRAIRSYQKRVRRFGA
ncbi:MAG: polyprenyl diphosphate synthase [Sulfolobales archaeon]|jgi:tritrans,polycis-undecaprenyl-diphosphate synthase [geranylgeranyl-diphosphate specific]|nr:polyprenyl diphosphate synthase [Sulfolobales archaeon]MDT7899667.1 polyprenyl diphosphate synthase [Sulfolobales archaeon]MDT7905898.1 polyprenyl diphosphate synthase [Sulfolobales archaeon]